MSNKHELVEWGWGFKQGAQYYYKNALQNFGLSSTELRALFEAQGRKCAACKCDIAWPMLKKAIMGYPFEVDHEHHNGEKRCSDKKYVRGLTCQICNKGLNKIRAGEVIGKLKEDAERLAMLQEYLANYKRKLELR